MNDFRLNFTKLNEKALLPRRASERSAGLDLCACVESDIAIAPGEIVMIPTGLAVEPENPECVLCIFARSGLAVKHGISLANGVGVVDSDYRGEICVGLINRGREPFCVTYGMRIAQLVVLPCFFAYPAEAEALSQTDRGTGGFGSTGMN